MQVRAELYIRLSACGLDGQMVLGYYTYGCSTNYLARRFHVDVPELHKRRKQVIRYCSGEELKQISYDDFCEQEESLHKVAN